MTTAETRAKRVKEWRESGLTVKEFAAKHGLVAGTLKYWSWQADHAAKRGHAFVRVKRAAMPSSAPIDVFVGDVRIVVPRGFDGAHLRDVIDALRALEAS